MTTLSRLALALLATLAILVGLDNLARPLANPDEGRYAEIAREMAASGDWVTPRLNGFKYFEKPPLQYWATAAAIRVIGPNEVAARAYTALCGILAVLAVAFTLRRLGGSRQALLAAGVLLSSPYFLALGGIVTLDMGLTAWLTVAMGAFLVAQAAARDDRERRLWMAVAWAAVALAVLSKGLVGLVLPAGTIFMHCLLHRDWKLLRRLELAGGACILAAIAAPWFILVSVANPEFAPFFFIHEHFTRFLTAEHRRVAAWWYFIPILFLGLLPWMFGLGPAVAAAWNSQVHGDEFHWRRFVVVFIAVVMAFFSASGSKLPAYILPVFPMAAMVLAEWIDRSDPRRLAMHVAPVTLVLAAGLVLAWGAPDRARSEWTRALYESARPWIVGGGVILVAGIAIATAMLRRRMKDAAIAMIVTVTLVFIDAVEDAYEQLSPRQSGMEIADAIRPHLTPGTPVYSVRHYDQSATFYLGRTVTLVDYVDEFALGLRAEPELALSDVEHFIERWRRPGNALAILQPGVLDRLKAEGLAFTTLHADERRVVIRKELVP